MPSMSERLRVITTQLWMYDGPFENAVALCSNMRKILNELEDYFAQEHAAKIADLCRDRPRLLVSIRVISELARQCEFEFAETRSGEECLAVLEANSKLAPAERYNLVMCDVMMHGMDGRECLTSRRAGGRDALPDGELPP